MPSGPPQLPGQGCLYFGPTCVIGDIGDRRVGDIAVGNDIAGTVDEGDPEIVSLSQIPNVTLPAQ